MYKQVIYVVNYSVMDVDCDSDDKPVFMSTNGMDEEEMKDKEQESLYEIPLHSKSDKSGKKLQFNRIDNPCWVKTEFST